MYILFNREIKTFFDNTNLSKYYTRTEVYPDGTYEVVFLNKDHQTAFTLSSNEEGEKKLEVIIDPTGEELKNPTPTIVLHAENWKELQEIIDAMQAAAKKGTDDGSEQ